MNQAPLISEERKRELLSFARSSRIKWVLDAADEQSLLIFKKGTSHKIPAADSLQETLGFLCDLVGDKEPYSIESLIPIDDEETKDNALPSYPAETDPYFIFIDKLRRPAASEIVNSMQQFVLQFKTSSRENSMARFTDNAEEDAAATQAIWTFMGQIMAHIQDNELWGGESAVVCAQSQECCEKFLFAKLHPLIFSPEGESCDGNGLTQDEALHTRIRSLSFLTAEHLDIKSLKTPSGESIEDAFLEPAAFLQELDQMRCPNDMIDAIKRCSMNLTQLLASADAQKQQNPGTRIKNVSGADDYLPLMILVLQRANPKRLHSILKYLQRYVNPLKLASESGYLLTHFVSAAMFLECADAHALTISPAEFDRCLSQCRTFALQQLKAADVSAGAEVAEVQEQPVKVNHEEQAKQAYPLVSAQQMRSVRVHTDVRLKEVPMNMSVSAKATNDNHASASASAAEADQWKCRYSAMLAGFNASCHGDSGERTGTVQREDKQQLISSSISHPKFWTCPSVTTLTMADMAILLEEYKNMTKVCAGLLADSPDV